MAALLARRERDGLSLQRLSKETGIPVGTLSWWTWRLRQLGGERAEAPARRATTFVEVTPTAAASCSGVTIVLADGTRVEVGAEFDADTLRTVLAALQPC